MIRHGGHVEGRWLPRISISVATHDDFDKGSHHITKYKILCNVDESR